MITLPISRPLTKGEMTRIFRRLPRDLRKKTKFFLNKEEEREKNPRVIINSDAKDDVLAVKKEIQNLKGVKFI